MDAMRFTKLSVACGVLVIAVFVFSGFSHAQPGQGQRHKGEFEDIREYDSLSSALAKIGSRKTVLLIPTSQKVVKNITIPENINLKFIGDGSLKLAPKVTVMFNSKPLAELDHIFRGAGRVVFKNTITPVLYPQWFGAKVDGKTDDIDAMDKAVACLKASGGGVIHITNKMVIGRTLVFTGKISNMPKMSPQYYGIIKVKGVGANAAIYGTIEKGNVIQLGTTGKDDMVFRLDLEDLIIDGGMKNVAVIHGGVSDGNHTINFKNLLIKGFSGPDSVGIEGGRITDSFMNTIVIQGQGSGKGIVARRSTMQLIDCRIFYTKHGLYIPSTAESNAQMIGGGILVCSNCITFEGPGPSWNANYFIGTFIAEGRKGNRILNVENSPAHGKDVSALTFQSCLFGGAENKEPLLDFSNFYGKINLIGCAVWGQSAGTRVLNGPNTELVMLGNSNMTLDTRCDKTKINRQFKDSDLTGTLFWNVPSIAPGSGYGKTSSSITVTGAKFGDFVLVAAPYDLQGVSATGYVNAPNSVQIRLDNHTGEVVNLGSGKWKVKILKFSN